jgi:hypothetical protein
MGHFDILGQRIGRDGVAVILRRDVNFAVRRSFTG